MPTSKLMLLPSFLALASLAGCAELDDYKYDTSMRIKAKCAWYQCHPPTVPCTASADYKDGWIAGYYDGSTGSCEAPALPPKKYWCACYDGLDAKRAVNRWYVGWQDGAAVARSRPNNHFISVWNPPAVVPYLPNIRQCYPGEQPVQDATTAWPEATGVTPPPAPLPYEPAPEAEETPATPSLSPPPADASPSKSPSAEPSPLEPSPFDPSAFENAAPPAVPAAPAPQSQSAPPMPFPPAVFEQDISRALPKPAVPAAKGRATYHGDELPPGDRPGVGAFSLDFTNAAPPEFGAASGGRVAQR